ncbi:MAG: HIT domain-containing protein [Acidobacteria bacterium]|jgi:ATP adenylyltransferase|nr:HIT domain-containing protein [Acidobacteriota bacterium]
MKFLKAPWRWDFISRIVREKGCVFCDALKKTDQESLICYKGNKFFIIMNRYPYNSGHLMIVPYRHIDSPDKIPAVAAVEMWELINKSMNILKRNFNPAGFNIGMNLGKAAGAGVQDHIHLHIVPRWEGDANFMPVICQTDVVSYDINTIFQILHKDFNLKKEELEQ